MGNVSYPLIVSGKLSILNVTQKTLQNLHVPGRCDFILRFLSYLSYVRLFIINKQVESPSCYSSICKDHARTKRILPR